MLEGIPERLLMGPGPSPVPSEVRLAMASPVLGHLDPEFLRIMDEVAEGLRLMFGTKNRLTLPLSGTGSAGMEAALVNWVEPNNRVLVVRNGLFGERIRDAATRLGAEVMVVDAPWGEPLSLAELRTVLDQAGTVDLVAVVMAETSTGVLQPLDGFADAVHEHGGLFLVDTVTAIGGMPVEVDARNIDIAFAGTQKCLSVPPGLAPFTANDQAAEKLTARRHPIPSWYLDMTMLTKYWGRERVYHHTAPISMVYGLKAGLDLIRAEGLSARFDRHRRASRALWAGFEAMGLELLVAPVYRLPSLTTVLVPDGVDDAGIRHQLLRRFNIEIGGGLGPLRGRIWRIGTMGHGARLESLSRLLSALEVLLNRSGGVQAAARTWEALA